MMFSKNSNTIEDESFIFVSTRFSFSVKTIKKLVIQNMTLRDSFYLVNENLMERLTLFLDLKKKY